MVAVTPSLNGNDNQVHVSCDIDWWGEDVPEAEALQIATEHEASLKHIAAEVADLLFETLAETLRADRGY